ncbi:MAG: dihydrofolate reductase, partial [Burkholderiaceae bacterium]
PEDLQHFKAATLGHAVIMGRKTFDSIGKPLPGRRIIVVSRNPLWQHPGCETAGDLQQALQLCNVPHALMTKTEQVFVAGGSQLYSLALPLASRLLITEINLTPDGDVSFPAPDASRWMLRSQAHHESKNGTGYTIQDWRLLNND